MTNGSTTQWLDDLSLKPTLKIMRPAVSLAMSFTHLPTYTKPCALLNVPAPSAARREDCTGERPHVLLLKVILHWHLRTAAGALVLPPHALVAVARHVAVLPVALAFARYVRSVVHCAAVRAWVAVD